MITFGLDLNLIPGKVLPRLNVSQYDKGQTVSVSLWNGDVPYSIPTGYTAQVVGTKADKTGFMYNCTIAHGQPSFVITDQMTIFPGEVTLEVIILDTDKRIGTINFILDVERAALADDTQISESDMPIIQQIPEYANAAAASAEEAREWAEQARGVTSFNGREGAVTPANGDYTASQITSSAIAGQNNVESALTRINTDLTGINNALTNDVGTSDLLQWAVQHYNVNSVVFAHYGGTADSKPSNSAGFIQVFGVSDSYIWIMAYSFDNHVYKRVKNSTWESNWTMIV